MCAFYLEKRRIDLEKRILDYLFDLARKSIVEDDFPVSAVVLDEDGTIIGEGYNCRKNSHKTTDHAEIIAIETANKCVGNWNLQNKCMVVTLEPCDMCKSVIKEARLSKVYYLVPRYSYKKQYQGTTFNYLETEDIKIDEYKEEIKNFFKNKR